MPQFFALSLVRLCNVKARVLFIVQFLICRGCILLLPPSNCRVLVLSCIDPLLEDQIPISLSVIPGGQSGQVHSYHSHSVGHFCPIHPYYCNHVTRCLWKICSSSSYRWTWIRYCSFSTNFLFRDECKHNILFTDSAHPCHFDSGNDHAHNIVLDHTQSKYTIKCQQSLANIIHHSISIHACMYTVYHFFDNYLCH